MTTKLTYNSTTQSWGETTFESYVEFRNFIESLWKTPGAYNLKNTSLWRPNAIKFQKDKRYTDIKDTRSREYKDFWNLEKRKCIEGVIIDGMFIPGDYYFYLNFCPIYNKIEKEYIHPEVWDSDYHFYLYLEKCYLYDMNSCVIKKRQCLVGSTVVYTPHGLMRIDDMVSNNYRGLVYSYDGTGIIEDRVTDAFSQGVVNQVYKVTTKGGASIECTSDHLINTTRGWVQAKDLTTKDILIGYSDNFNHVFKIQVVDKEVEVFDLTVENTSSFFANGIHVHNCGYSLKHVSIQIKNVWFIKGSINKLLSYDETFVRANWNSIAEIYRDHLNEHTGWYRNFNPDKTLEWMQKVEIQEGILEKKKVSKGRKSKYLGYTTKGNPTKPVGGPAHTIFIDEAGINPTLNKTYRYGEENTRIGGVKTGYIYVSGAVGELKDCEPLQEFAFNPTANGFLGVKDIFANSDKEICFFVPDIWNFIYTDPDTRQTVKCYDQDGNSNIPMALKFYNEWDEFQKKQLGERDYKLWKCQHPLTLQEAFEQRESNIFPTSLLKKRDMVLIGNKPMVVKIVRDSKGKLGHEFCDDIPITKLKVNPEDNNAGAIQVIEFPPINPPWGMYYAGVDPVWRINTSTSKSLQSVTIYRGMVEKDGKLVHGYPVAVYTGRHKHIEETYDTTAKLIEYYNAKAAVESNVKDFIEWMIQKGKAKYLMRRREITLISEMIPNSTIRDEIGVRMEGEFKKRCLEKVISYIEQPISTEYDLETGESSDIYGIEKLWDRMLIKEMLEWHPKLNTDRLIAFSLALIAATSDINRQLVVVPTERLAPKPVKMYSPFQAKSLPQTKKITGHFRR